MWSEGVSTQVFRNQLEVKYNTGGSLSFQTPGNILLPLISNLLKIIVILTNNS